MNLTTFRSKVALTLGNMQSSDPFYSEIDGWVNEALDEVVKLAIMRGGDDPLQGIETEWTDTTLTGDSDYALPSTLLAIRSVGHFNGDTSPDLDRDKITPVPYVGTETFFFIERGTATEGYPRIHTRTGQAIRFWPTPSADYITSYMIIGTRKDSQLSADGDSPVMSDIWHGAVLEMALSIGADRRGWYQEAAVYKSNAMERIASAQAVQAIEWNQRIDRAQYEAPDRMSVYGEAWR